MAKPSFFKALNRAGENSLEAFWRGIGEKGLADAGVSPRFFQLFARAAADDALAASPTQTAILRGTDVSATVLSALSLLDSRSAPTSTPDHIVNATPDNRPTPAEGPDDGQADPIVTFVLASSEQASVRLAGGGMVGSRLAVPQYTAIFSDDGSGLVYDTMTKQLLPGGPGDYPNLFDGGLRMMLSGDYASGSILTGTTIWAIDSIELLGGHSYNLTAADDLVGAGRTLNISAASLALGDHFLFDGSLETDGSYFVIGSRNADSIIGGGGDDRFYGLGGPDLMSGGGGSDTFIYASAGESSGLNYDTLGDFDVANDRIDLPSAVTGFGAPIEGGVLSQGSFGADLAAVLGGLAANQAVWFAPDSGDLAGTIFLVVDANGVAGYQDGEDYVFAIGGTPLADLTGHTDIFV